MIIPNSSSDISANSASIGSMLDIVMLAIINLDLNEIVFLKMRIFPSSFCIYSPLSELYLQDLNHFIFNLK